MYGTSIRQLLVYAVEVFHRAEVRGTAGAVAQSGSFIQSCLTIRYCICVLKRSKSQISKNKSPPPLRVTASNVENPWPMRDRLDESVAREQGRKGSRAQRSKDTRTTYMKC